MKSTSSILFTCSVFSIIHSLIQSSKSLPTILPSNRYLLKYLFHNQITPQTYSWVKHTPPAQFSYSCFLALGPRTILFSLSILAPKILRYSKLMQIYEVNPVASEHPCRLTEKINCSWNSFLNSHHGKLKRMNVEWVNNLFHTGIKHLTGSTWDAAPACFYLACHCSVESYKKKSAPKYSFFKVFSTLSIFKCLTIYFTIKIIKWRACKCS